jgi:hypothetical protein
MEETRYAFDLGGLTWRGWPSLAHFNHFEGAPSKLCLDGGFRRWAGGPVIRALWQVAQPTSAARTNHFAFNTTFSIAAVATGKRGTNTLRPLITMLR